MTSASMSYPWMSAVTSCLILSCASVDASYQCFFGIRLPQFSAVNSRFIPGAMSAAIMAASITKVPLPQNGSTRIRSLFQGVSRINAAASVSEIGAFPLCGRYPLLCRDSPVVSIPTVTTSFLIKTRTGYSLPSSGNQFL